MTARARVKPDSWDARRGVKVFFGRGFVFLPWDQVTPVADALIDAYEQHTDQAEGEQ